MPQRSQAVTYAWAQERYESADYDKAEELFMSLGNYSDAASQAAQVRSSRLFHTVARDTTHLRKTIAAGGTYTAALRENGTVVLTGSGKYDLSEAPSWRNITALEIGSGHIVGLTAEGTAVAAGYNKYGQCDVSEWTDIISISAGANHTVGLKSDGTVVAVGYNLDGQCEVSNWKTLLPSPPGGYHTLGLRADGHCSSRG